MVSFQPPADWQQWVDWLAAGLHGRNRWRLSIILLGIVFACGRRTVTTWLRAVGIHEDFAGYYYFLQPLGRQAQQVAERLFALLILRLVRSSRVLLAVDDSPTKRYGPKVQGAGIHRNPTPGPADQKFLYGHVWVTISLLLRHSLWNTLGLPLIGLLYVRAADIAKLPAPHHWKFRTKLELASEAILNFAFQAKRAGKSLWVVADGAYAKRPFLKPLRAAGITLVSRLRKDAAVFDLPSKPRRPRPGQPRKYGRKRIHLARRGAHRGGWTSITCSVYGREETKTIKTFLATYRPAGGVIRVVIVQEDQGCQYFFCTDPQASPQEILEAMADRSAIEQDFHDVKEVWGAGQQQVRTLWANIAVFNLNLWVQSLLECWCWHKPAEELRDRSDSPWDDPQRRPSHADRRKALRREILRKEYLSLSVRHRCSSRIRRLYQRLLQLAT